MSELIENCFVLSVKAVLRSIDRAEPLEAALNGHRFGVQCQFNTTTDPSAILTYTRGQEPQKIALEWQDLTFGRTAYFRCSCGYRCRHLYLPPGRATSGFGCRQCHHLKYELSSINRSSVHGKLFYRTNRMIKLASKREEMRRIFHKGDYTHRYQRFLKLCDRAGLSGVVNDARDLLNAVQAQSF